MFRSASSIIRFGQRRFGVERPSSHRQASLRTKQWRGFASDGSSSSSSTAASPIIVNINEKQAQEGTERWIREYVMEQNLCPFAFHSQYKIVPWCYSSTGSGGDGNGHDEEENVFVNDFIDNVLDYEIQRLLGRIQHKQDDDNFVQFPTTFLVFPNFEPLQDPQIFEFVYRDLCYNHPILGDMSNFISTSSGKGSSNDHKQAGRPEQTLTMQVFHPKFSETNYAIRSPWPTMQLMSTQDLLEREDGVGDHDIGTMHTSKFVRQNISKLESVGNTTLQEMLDAYKSF